MNKVIPFLFIFLWSTGFIAIKYGLQYSSSGDFLMLRTLANLAVFSVLIFFISKRDFKQFNIVHAMVTGLFIHGAYLVGVFFAIDQGMPAGVTGIIVGFQPLLTAFIAMVVLNEKLSKLQWLALLLGLLGLTLVVSGSLKLTSVSLWGITLAVIALFGITIGTIYQKRFCQNQPLLPSVFWQYVPCLFLFSFISLAQQAPAIEWHLNFFLSLAWLVVALSVVAILLLMYLLEHGGAAKVSSYFYLVPPLTALEAWYLFDEALTTNTIIGMLLCAVSVFMVMRKPSKQAVELEIELGVEEKLHEQPSVAETEVAGNITAQELPEAIKA